MTQPICRIIRYPEEFPTVYAIRVAVFVQEQACPEDEERDHWEDGAIHFVLEVGDEPCGTARLVELKPGVGKISRVALLPAARGRGWGARLMRMVLEHAEAHGMRELVLDAQTEVIPFYEKLGFTAEGPEFLDAGILHRKMRRRSVDE